MLNVGLNIIVALFLLTVLPCRAALLDDGAFETINISADEAYEDIQPGILHFRGHFLMQGRDWRLESGRATVYGPPERPDKVYLEGTPVRLTVDRNDGSGRGAIVAVAAVLEYMRSTNMLKLSGGAVLKLDGEVIRSSLIEYNISTDRYWAGGADGVTIEVAVAD